MAADGTVRGGFELTSEQALRSLHDIRDAGREADAALESLGIRMDTLSRKRATPSVDLSGFDRVNAQLTELEARLDRLDQRRVSPSVGITGGFARNLTGLGGGGGSTPSVGRDYRSGGGGGLFSSLGGIPGKLPWWAAALPLAPPLIGGATGLVGSAGAGLLGAGTVGLGALGPLAAGGASTLAIVKPAISALQQLTKTQNAYNTAVQEYGRQSTQAASAARKYNEALVANPMAAGAARQLGLARGEFGRATAPARANIYAGISGTIYNARRAIPTFALGATQSTGAVSQGAQAFSGFLAQPGEQAMMLQLTGAFAQNLPIAERSLENIATTFLHLSVDAVPFFHEANLWVQHWTAGLASSSNNTVKVQSDMRGLVNSAREWAHLTGTTGKLLKDIFSAGRPSGDSMVVQLTGTLDRWDRWVQNNPTKVREFFTSSEQSVGRIATIIGNLTGDVFKLLNYLQPIFQRAEQFIGFASSLGGGSLLTGAGVLFAGYQGARRGIGGGGPSAGGLLSSFVLGGGPRGGGGGRAPGGGVVAAEVAAATATRTGYLAPSLRAVPEAFQGAYGGIQGARYAAPTSALGATATAELSGAAGLLGKGAAGAAGFARAAGPVLIGLSVLQGIGTAISTGGGVSHAVGAGLSSAASSLTLGTVKPSQFQSIFHAAFGTTNAGSSISSPQFSQALGGLGRQAANVRTPEQMRAVQTRVDQLRITGFEMSPADQAKLQHFLNAAANTAAQNAGAQASNTWEDSFTRGLQRMPPTKAVNMMLRGMESQLKSLGPRGGKAFAQDTATWVAQMEKDNPKLIRPLERLMDGITHRLNQLQHTTGKTFADLQQKVFYFNGQILTGSQTTWGQIRDAMINPAQVAQEKLSGIWGTIQIEAIDALSQMGYSKSAAKSVVTNLAKGGTIANIQSQLTGNVTSGNATAGLGHLGGAPASLPRKNERGGMISGTGLLDTVRLPDGGVAAPGEAWIANRHTMNALSSATIEKFGKSAWQMIRDEGRPHSAPMKATRGYATGGLVMNGSAGFSNSTAGGARYSFPFGGSGWSWSRTDQGVDFGGNAPIGAIGPFTVTYSNASDGWYPPAPAFMVYQLTGGPDAGKYIYVAEHISGMAPVGTSGAAGQSIAQMTGGIEMGWAAGPHGHQIIQPMSGDHLTAAGQDFHAFLMGLTHGQITGGKFGGGGGVGRPKPISLKTPRPSLGGVPGAMQTGAGRIYAKGLQDRVNAAIGATGGGGGGSGLGSRITASWFDDPQTASGRAHVPGFAELSNPPGSLNFSAMGHLPMGELVNFFGNGWSTTIPKVDVGAGGSGLGGLVRAADFTKEAAAGIPGMLASGLMDVSWRDTGRRAFERGGRVDWAGWNAKGGSFTTTGPTLFGVGEHGNRETVHIGRAGAGGRQIIVHMEHVYLGAGDPQTLERVGQDVAGRIIDALDGSNGASDSQLAGVA